MQNILIVEPSTSGLELLPNAKLLGLFVIVFSADRDERVIPEIYRQYIDKIIVVDTNDIAAMTAAVNVLHQEHPLAAVVPGFEIFVAHAARLAQALNLPSVSHETGDALRNKGMMRAILQKKGVRVPKFTIIETAEQTIAAANEIGFPCVIKPIDQSGSVHVSRANNLIELRTAYLIMSADPWTEMGKGVGSVAIIEEYISGPEYSVEGYIDANGAHIVSITEKILGPEPFFVELGHIVQADIDEAARAEVISYIIQVVAALKMNVGVFHAEIRLSAQGPVLMEISGRLAGDKICDLIFLATGVNLYKVMLLSHLGAPIEIEEMPQFYAGIHYFSTPDMESYSEIVGVDKIQEIPGFYDFKFFIRPGEPIPALTSFLGRVGCCIFTATSYDEVKQRLTMAKHVIRFQ